MNLTEPYLQELWEAQSGDCAIRGIPMVPIHKGTAADRFYAASLDRIHSDTGYVKGNVQFILRPLNLAKGDADDDDFRMFVKELAESLRG